MGSYLYNIKIHIFQTILCFIKYDNKGQLLTAEQL